MKIPVFKCPHCGHNLGYAVDAHMYGSPVRECPNCKKMYLDNRYHEIALEGIRRQDIDPTEADKQSHRKSGRNAILLGVGMLALFFLILFTGWIVFPLPIFGVISIIGGIAAMKGDSQKELEKTRAALELEKQQSLQRVQNPQYIAQLQAMGYRFPQRNGTVPAQEQTPAQQMPPIMTPPVPAHTLPPQSAFCRQCGAQLSGEEKFCAKCGAPQPLAQNR